MSNETKSENSARAQIQTRVEGKRGCGYRKGGGLYMVSGGTMVPCGKLPIPLEVCPCCNGGIKFSRGFTWVDGDALLKAAKCDRAGTVYCSECPLTADSIGRAGLLWIGEKFYKTPEDWISEAKTMGVSRRIPAIPKDFEVGKHWVLVAHIKAIEKECEDCTDSKNLLGAVFNTDGGVCEKCNGSRAVYQRGIFHAFKPTAIEYVVKGDESDAELEKMIKRGLTLVRIAGIGQTHVLTKEFGRFPVGAIVRLKAVSESGIATVVWGDPEVGTGEVPVEYLEIENYGSTLTEDGKDLD